MDTELKELSALIRASSAPTVINGGKPFQVIPTDHKLEDCERMLPAPIRKRGTATFTSEKSFVRYVNEHKTAASRIFSKELPKISFSAILDFHGKDPSWGDHTACFAPELSQAWLRWTAAMGKPMNQTAFAEFIERNVSDIKTPAGAIVLEIAENLTAKCDVRFDQKIGIKDGKTRLVYEEDIAVSGGGKSTLTSSFDLPRTISTEIQVFVGAAPTPITWRVRPSVRDRQLMFSIECPYIGDIMEQQFDALTNSIRAETNIEPFRGQFTP